MDENRKAELQEQAQGRLAIQRARVRQLRQRCIAASLICFALLWGVVFTQLVSGNDPVLAPKAKGKTKTASAATASSGEVEQVEIEAAESEASELEAAEIEVSELEAAELEAAQAEAEAEEVTTSPS
jgi:hypothetical protein